MPLKYDSSVGQYRGENGRFVSRAKVLDVIEEEVLRLESMLRNEVRKAIAGQLTAIDLAESMSQKLKISSIQVAAIAQGGIDRMTTTHYGTIGRIQRERNQRLKGFVDVLVNGEITERQALQRATQYAGTIKQVFSLFDHKEQSQYYQYARRVMNPLAMHCSQCIAHEQKGWVLATKVVPIGTKCDCRQHCKCAIYYRN